MSIIPGIENGAPERTETSSGSTSSPSRLPMSASSARGRLGDLVHQPVGQRVACGHVRLARLGRDREARRDREAELRHLGEVRALAAEQELLLLAAFLEGVHVLHHLFLRLGWRAASRPPAYGRACRGRPVRCGPAATRRRCRAPTIGPICGTRQRDDERDRRVGERTARSRPCCRRRGRARRFRSFLPSVCPVSASTGRGRAGHTTSSPPSIRYVVPIMSPCRSDASSWRSVICLSRSLRVRLGGLGVRLGVGFGVRVVVLLRGVGAVVGLVLAVLGLALLACRACRPGPRSCRGDRPCAGYWSFSTIGMSTDTKRT